jgi:multiple sugar transport system permease protein
MSTSRGTSARGEQISPKFVDRLRDILRIRGVERREAVAFHVFAAPWILGFLVFTLIPFIASLVLSLTRYEIVTPPVWAGAYNYIKLTRDPLILQSLKVTTLYSVGSVLLGIIVAFLVALLMNQDIAGINIWRTVYYLPSTLSGVPVALLWMWVFSPNWGLLNTALSWFGIEGPQWLFSRDWVIPALILMSLWSIGGAMVIFLAGLQGIPQHLYESAELDGAGLWHKFRYVTIPMVSPVIFFNLIMGTIGAFRSFTNAYVMTDGGPANASLFYVLYLYRRAFEYHSMGYACAMAWVLFGIILVLTLVLFRTSSYWVYYEGAIEG